jgi:hypothetical protein
MLTLILVFPNLSGEVILLKEWKCVQVGHHNRIGLVIGEHEREGWSLHTYQAQGTPTMVNHYLLFEREQ